VWQMLNVSTANLYVIHCRTRHRLSVFGHIARLTQGSPAHNALHCQVGLASGRSLGRDWRRHPGQLRVRRTDELRNDTGSVPANLWRQAILRGMVERRDGSSWLRDLITTTTTVEPATSGTEAVVVWSQIALVSTEQY